MSVCGLQLDNLLIIDDRNSRTEYLLHVAASGRSQRCAAYNNTNK